MIKRHDNQSMLTSLLRKGGTTVAAIGMMGALAMGASGCDTVAKISFSERSFQGIQSAGFIAPSGSCQGVDGQMKTRFVLTDNDNFPIALGDTLDNKEIALETNSISFNDSALFEVNETQICGAGGTGSCGTNFSCGTAPGITPGDNPAEGTLEACVQDDSLSIPSGSDSVQFISDTDDDQVFGVVMENTGGLEGYLPPDAGDYWDKNGNGVTGDPGDGGNPGEYIGGPIATDDSALRSVAVFSQAVPYESIADAARAKRRRTYYGLWSFNSNDTTPFSHVTRESDRSPWVEDPDFVREQAMTHYGESTLSVQQSTSNLYETLENVISNHYDEDAMTELGVSNPGSVEKILTVFVDGPDELRERDGADLAEVIQLATDNNVRVFVVHLDAEIEQPELLREDPNYFEGQNEADALGPDGCSDDSECKNYESCREPRGYSDVSGEPVTSIEAEYQGKKWCLPEYRPDGRIGPIDDFAQLACATEGGYMYVPSPLGLQRNMQWLPYALDGLWEATVNSTSFTRDNVPAGAPLKVHTSMNVSLSGTSLSYSFSQLGDLGNASADSVVDDFDTRSVIFTAPDNP